MQTAPWSILKVKGNCSEPGRKEEVGEVSQTSSYKVPTDSRGSGVKEATALQGARHGIMCRTWSDSLVKQHREFTASVSWRGTTWPQTSHTVPGTSSPAHYRQQVNRTPRATLLSTPRAVKQGLWEKCKRGFMAKGGSPCIHPPSWKARM